MHQLKLNVSKVSIHSSQVLSVYSSQLPFCQFTVHSCLFKQVFRGGCGVQMATLDKAEALLEDLRSASWDAAVKDLEDVKAFAAKQVGYYHFTPFLYALSSPA